MASSRATKKLPRLPSGALDSVLPTTTGNSDGENFAVEQYPLSDLVKEDAADGREKGVAVIVSINKNRNDAWKLPEDILDLAELEVFH